MKAGTLKSVKVEPFRDTTTSEVILTVEFFDANDVEEVHLLQHNVDRIPPLGSLVIVDDSSDNWKFLVASSDGQLSSKVPGEHEVYATKNDAKVCKTRWKADGTTVFDDGTDYAVRFSKLQEAFDKLKGDFNTLVTETLAHTHPVAGAVASASKLFLTSKTSTADISGAKIDRILVP